jgi:protein disulfide-isomerase
LHTEVFGKTAFQEWAKENVVLLIVDFPARKKQSGAVKKQNAQLAEHFKIEGYPTIMLMTPKGMEIKRWLGAPGATPATFIASVGPAAKKAKK